MVDEERETPKAVWMRMAVAAAVIFALSGGSVAAQDVSEMLLSPINQRSDVPCPDPSTYSLVRPDAQGTPTLVGLALYLQDISTLSDVDPTMTSDVYLVARWVDSRLSDPERGEASVDCPVPTGTLWMPSIEPENLRSRQVFYSPRFLVDGRGVVTYIQRQLLQTSHPLDLRDFPLDRHEWKFTLWPTLSRADELQFQTLSPLVARNSEISLQ
jgi:hypothetical protein